jgi:hypothetical protein
MFLFGKDFPCNRFVGLLPLLVIVIVDCGSVDIVVAAAFALLVLALFVRNRRVLRQAQSVSDPFRCFGRRC